MCHSWSTWYRCSLTCEQAVNALDLRLHIIGVIHIESQAIEVPVVACDVWLRSERKPGHLNYAIRSDTLRSSVHQRLLENEIEREPKRDKTGKKYDVEAQDFRCKNKIVKSALLSSLDDSPQLQQVRVRNSFFSPFQMNSWNDLGLVGRLAKSSTCGSVLTSSGLLIVYLCLIWLLDLSMFYRRRENENWARSRFE